ncbi:uncharacterized protein [Dermacentor albipictus]|uniref:uncharacterized protein isoform X1 n=1 Tax=Dermacentor albipictus TaxID=60249 RepID=UPI0038FC3066
MRLGVQLIVIVTLVAPHLVVAIFFKLLSPGRIAYFCLRSETEFFESRCCTCSREDFRDTKRVDRCIFVRHETFLLTGSRGFSFVLASDLPQLGVPPPNAQRDPGALHFAELLQGNRPLHGRSRWITFIDGGSNSYLK